MAKRTYDNSENKGFELNHEKDRSNSLYHHDSLDHHSPSTREWSGSVTINPDIDRMEGRHKGNDED